MSTKKKEKKYTTDDLERVRGSDLPSLRTREGLAGWARVAAMGLAPWGVWAQQGAKIDIPSLAFVSIASFGAALTAIHLWFQKDPRPSAKVEPDIAPPPESP